jgi:cellulose synthase/poly-beta-1,6-N-acetylglucosamine synthase-like glycosyltransferase
MVHILIILIFVYLIVFSVLIYYLAKPSKNENFFNGNYKISIIVPLRNEEKNLKNLINGLLLQQYHNIEIIFVNDHSTDNTYEIIQELAFKNSNIKVINLNDDEFGKKYAIKKGINVCSGSWVVLTDADVHLNSLWLLELSKYFNDYELIMAPVLICSKKTNFLNIFEFFDTIAMQLLSYSASNAGYPFLASGANMAIKREIIAELYENINLMIPSGDDVFLLHNYLKKYNKAKFIFDDNAVVYVNPNSSLKSFIRQRLRWSSKVVYYRNTAALFFSLLIFLTHFIGLLTFLKIVFWGEVVEIFFVCIILKLIVDLLFVRKANKLIKISYKYWLFFPVVWFLYYFYISFVPLASIFIKINWKDRKW